MPILEKIDQDKNNLINKPELDKFFLNAKPEHKQEFVIDLEQNMRDKKFDLDYQSIADQINSKPIKTLEDQQILGLLESFGFYTNNNMNNKILKPNLIVNKNAEKSNEKTAEIHEISLPNMRETKAAKEMLSQIENRYKTNFPDKYINLQKQTQEKSDFNQRTNTFSLAHIISPIHLSIHAGNLIDNMLGGRSAQEKTNYKNQENRYNMLLQMIDEYISAQQIAIGSVLKESGLNDQTYKTESDYFLSYISFCKDNKQILDDFQKQQEFKNGYDRDTKKIIDKYYKGKPKQEDLDKKAYIGFNKELADKYGTPENKSKIEKANKSLNKDASQLSGSEEQDIDFFVEYMRDTENIKSKYGNEKIERYGNYKTEIFDLYNKNKSKLEQYKNTGEKLNKLLNEKSFDFGRIQKFQDVSKKIQVHENNINIAIGNYSDKNNTKSGLLENLVKSNPDFNMLYKAGWENVDPGAKQRKINEWFASQPTRFQYVHTIGGVVSNTLVNFVGSSVDLVLTGFSLLDPSGHYVKDFMNQVWHEKFTDPRIVKQSSLQQESIVQDGWFNSDKLSWKFWEAFDGTKFSDSGITWASQSASSIANMILLIKGGKMIGGKSLGVNVGKMSFEGTSGLIKMSMLMSVGPSFKKYSDSGFDGQSAALAAFLESGIVAGMELINVGPYFSKNTLKTLLTKQSFFKVIMKDLLGENLQELSQTGAEKFVEMVTNNVGNFVGSKGNIDVQFTAEEVMNTIILTSIATLTVGAKGNINNVQNNNKDYKFYEKMRYNPELSSSFMTFINSQKGKNIELPGLQGSQVIDDALIARVSEFLNTPQLTNNVNDNKNNNLINQKLTVEKAQLPMTNNKHEYVLYNQDGSEASWNSFSIEQQKKITIQAFKQSIVEDLAILGDINYVNKTGYAFSQDTKVPGDIDYAIENNPEKIQQLITKLKQLESEGKIKNLKFTHKNKQEEIISESEIQENINTKELRITYDGLTIVGDNIVSINREMFIEDGKGIFEINLNKEYIEESDIDGKKVRFLTPEGYIPYAEDLLVTDLDKEFGETAKKLKIAKRIDDYIDALSAQENTGKKTTVFEKIINFITGKQISKTKTQRMIESLKASDRYKDTNHVLHKQYIDAVAHLQKVLVFKIENVKKQDFNNISPEQKSEIISESRNIKERIKKHKSDGSQESIQQLKQDKLALEQKLLQQDLSIDENFYLLNEYYLLTQTEEYRIDNVSIDQRIVENSQLSDSQKISESQKLLGVELSVDGKDVMEMREENRNKNIKKYTEVNTAPVEYSPEYKISVLSEENWKLIDKFKNTPFEKDAQLLLKQAYNGLDILLLKAPSGGSLIVFVDSKAKEKLPNNISLGQKDIERIHKEIYKENYQDGSLQHIVGYAGGFAGSFTTDNFEANSHYGQYINETYRGKSGLGTLGRNIKEYVDGKLSKEYSGKASNTLFLLKRGYVPKNFIDKEGNIIEMSIDQQTEVQNILKEFPTASKEAKVKKEPNFEIMLPFTIELEYNPEKSKEIIDNINIENVSDQSTVSEEKKSKIDPVIVEFNSQIPRESRKPKKMSPKKLLKEILKKEKGKK